jgi:WhiB family transcriptional regulator, redox-sensing transcriptional regulator
MTPEWMADAACRGYPTEWWFPERGEMATEAKAICARCPVAEQCLELGLSMPTGGGHGYGIWGGVSIGYYGKRRLRRVS